MKFELKRFFVIIDQLFFEINCGLFCKIGKSEIGARWHIWICFFSYWNLGVATLCTVAFLNSWVKMNFKKGHPRKFEPIDLVVYVNTINN